MTWQPVHPVWSSRGFRELDDLHWLAYAVDREKQSAFAAGVGASLGWIRGGRVAPVTERDESPVTRELATAETWACAAAATPGIRPPPLEEICRELGVRNWPVLPAGVGWAEGGEVCLRWLLGRQDRPPLPIPERLADGSLPSPKELMEREIAARPWAFEEPERRLELRRRAESTARRDQQLEDLIARTKASLASGQHS